VHFLIRLSLAHWHTHPCDETVTHILWKLLIFFQFFKENAEERTKKGIGKWLVKKDPVQ